jgi:hypothetical protein
MTLAGKVAQIELSLAQLSPSLFILFMHYSVIVSVCMSDIMCIFFLKAGTHNDIQNACGTPYHFSQLCSKYTFFVTSKACMKDE